MFSAVGATAQAIVTGTPMHTIFQTKSFRVAGLVAVAGLALAACSKEPSADKMSAGEFTLGNPAAKVTVVEYASVACPLCAQFNKTVMPQFTSKYIDSNEVRYVYRPMMTGNPAVATAGHLLAGCAGKDKVFKVIDAIMRSQQEMGGEETGYANARPVLLDIGKSVGLSEDAVNKCITDPQGIDALNKANDKALKDDGVDGTPTFFVNGKKLTRTKGDLSDFDNAIQPLLKK